MVNTAYSTSQTQVGVGIETTRGTAASSFSWLPVKAPKYAPKLTMITDDTLQGSMVGTYGLIPGLRSDSHGWDGYPRLDTFPLLVRAALGSSDTITDAPTSTTLSAAATAGATTVTASAAVAAGSWIIIGSGSTQETHRVASVSSDTLTLDYPLRYAQASGATVAGLTGHSFSLLNNAGSGNQPPSCTIVDYDGEEWRQLTSAQLSKLTVKGTATGLVDYTVDWVADPSTTPEDTPSVSFTTAQPVPGWAAQVSIGGSQVGHLVDWELDFDRKVTEIPALTGTQNYFLYFAGPLELTGKITVVEESDAPELDDYLAGTNVPLDIVVTDVNSGYALRIHSSNAKFTTGSLDRSKTYVEAQLDVTPLPSATDATSGGVSPVQVTVANDTTTSY